MRITRTAMRTIIILMFVQTTGCGTNSTSVISLTDNHPNNEGTPLDAMLQKENVFVPMINETKSKSVGLTDNHPNNEDTSLDIALHKENLILNAFRKRTKTTLSDVTATLTCRDLGIFQRSYSGMSMEIILDLLGLKDSRPPYNPKDEIKYTAQCRSSNRDSLNRSEFQLALQTPLVNFFVYLLLLICLMMTNFFLVSSDSTEANDGKNVSWIRRTLLRILNLFCIDLKERCGKDGYCLLSFGKSLIIILFIATIISAAEVNSEISMFIAMLCLLAFFITSLVTFYCHGYIGNNILTNTAKHKNRRTLLFSGVSDCTETFFRQNFQGVAKVSRVKRVDILEHLDEELQITKETLEVLNKLPLSDQPEIKKLFQKPVDAMVYYEQKKQEIQDQIRDELNRIDTQLETSAFVTFRTGEIAAEIYKNSSFHHPYRVEWAPPVEDIVWATIHQQRKRRYLFKIIALYVLRVLATLVAPSLIFAITKLHFSDDSDVVLFVLPYLRSILTIFFLAIALGLDLINHSRNSSTHIGLFFSTLAIQIVSEIILPMFFFTDIIDWFQWMAADRRAVDHSLRFICFFRPGLGSEMAIAIIKWTFLQNSFFINRIAEPFHKFRFWLTSKTRLEAKIKFKRRKIIYEIGNRYAELITQWFMTLIGYFTYPPILTISLFCMIIRVLIDGYNLCNMFAFTITGIKIHRWAIFSATLAFVIACGLMFHKLFLVKYVDTEETSFWELFFAQGAVSFFILLTILILTMYFYHSPPHMAYEKAQSEECNNYDPPIHTSWTCKRYETFDEESLRSEEEKQDVNQERDEDGSIPVPAELSRRIKAISIILVTLSSVVILLVTVMRLFHVPEIRFDFVKEVHLIVQSEYKLGLFSGRVPYAKMLEVCSSQNPDKSNFGWLTLESRCEDILLDQAIRDNHEKVFKNLKPWQRMIWTGGLYNLTESENWKWLNPKATTHYENFCNATNHSSQIAKAKADNEKILYIIKDYTGGNLERNGLGCWQSYSKTDLGDLGFNVGSQLTSSQLGPRLTFVCKKGY